jgi:NADPH:quinone reductase-like Zn-dependent oxidoreductase
VHVHAAGLDPGVWRLMTEGLAVIRDFIEAGQVTPIIDRIYPLGDTAKAISHARRSHAGMVVITIQVDERRHGVGLALLPETTSSH